MQFYTSVNINYFAKARVLAKSLKQYCSNAKFSLVLCDRLPKDIDLANEPFDEIISVEDLKIPVDNLNLWIFMHTVVELCTAVKGQALVNFLERGSDKVVYLDPDTAVFDDLRELEALLDKHDVILTPHQSLPEKTKFDVINNEICSLKHGAYNFGFYAVANTENGLKFARWWRDRLVDFCYDDIPNGLFTDQKWGDIVPAMFDGIYILREPNYNVSTWNLTNRRVNQNEEQKYFVNDLPLQFYHFSGFDSGAQEAVLKIYGKDNPVVWNLRNWYIKRQDEEEQKRFYGERSFYNYYNDGEKIQKEQRLLLRNREDLLHYFKDANPYLKQYINGKSYYEWYQNEVSQQQKKSGTCLFDKYAELLSQYQSKLDQIMSNGKKNILQFLHSDFSTEHGDNCGGVQLHVKDIVLGSCNDFNYFVVARRDPFLLLTIYTGSLILKFQFAVASSQLQSPAIFTEPSHAALLRQILQDFRIELVHVHHVMTHTFDVYYEAKRLGIPIVTSIHDFYFVCPKINLLDASGMICMGKCQMQRGALCLEKIWNIKVDEDFLPRWRKEITSVLENNEVVLFPSNSAKDIFVDFYPQTKGVRILEHGVSVERSYRCKDLQEELRIGFIGGVFKHKGSEVIMDIVHKATNQNIKWHTFGVNGETDFISFESPNLNKHGAYQRKELRNLVDSNDIDIVCLLSICPETFCYTLSEAVALGRPVIATDIGAIGERVRKMDCGWLVPVDASAEQILQLINYIRQHPEQYREKCGNINKLTMVSTAEMVRQYAHLYQEFAHSLSRQAVSNVMLSQGYLLANGGFCITGSEIGAQIELQQLKASLGYKVILKLRQAKIPFRMQIKKLVVGVYKRYKKSEL